jgi:hypothetical protein
VVVKKVRAASLFFCFMVLSKRNISIRVTHKF